MRGSHAPNAITDFGSNAFNQLCAQQAGTALSTPPACPTTSPAFTYDKNGDELAAPGPPRRAMTWRITQTMLGGVAMVYLGSGQDRKTGEGTAALQHNVLGLGKRTSGTSTDDFTRDDGGKLVSRRNGTARHYYLFDALGSVTGLIDSSGAVSERYDYEPYGTPAPRGTGQWGATTGAADVATGQFGYTAGYRSVGGLYQFGQRYYDPALMRWTQPDPLDQAGDLREGNRYIYAGADPVNSSDPSGLHECQYHRSPYTGPQTPENSACSGQGVNPCPGADVGWFEPCPKPDTGWKDKPAARLGVYIAGAVVGCVEGGAVATQATAGASPHATVLGCVGGAALSTFYTGPTQ